MPQCKSFLTLSFAILISASTFAQDADQNEKTDLPGDQFSLPGALQLFKNASNLEEFEKSLNTESNNVNNLDLNNDDKIDYVRVIDKSENDVHAIVLQALVSESESQDIAVIEIEKNGNESAMIQIIGDEDVYGEKTVVEPDAEQEKSGFEYNFGTSGDMLAHGPAANIGQQVFVNVWFWPSVRFVFAPGYRPWASPWRWRHYPAWWSPWRPFGWSAWRPRCGVYIGGPFVVVRTHRVVRAHRVYVPHRTTSVIVRTRYAGPIRTYRVKTTRVTGPRGNKVIIRDVKPGRGGKVIKPGRGRRY